MDYFSLLQAPQSVLYALAAVGTCAVAAVALSLLAQPPATTIPAATKSAKTAVRKQSSLSAQVSDTISDAAIRAAILLKQSPIPDALAKWTSSTVESCSRVETAFGIHDRVTQLSQAAVKGGLTAASIAASAAIKAGVAYQTAPSYNELYGYETECSDNDCQSTDDDQVGTLSKNQLEVFHSSEKGVYGTHRVLAKRARKRRSANTLSHKPSIASLLSKSTLSPQATFIQVGPCVRIVKLDTSLPGGFPLKETVEMGTSTDPAITGLGNIEHQNDACFACGRVGLARITPYNDVAGVNSFCNATTASQSAFEEKQVSILSSIYNTGTNVAGHFVTASSDYLLGKETTEILFGPKDAEKQNGPMTAEDAFVYETTIQAKALLAASPIRCFCVGGVYCATSLRTLMRARGSKLKKWFAGFDEKGAQLDESIVREWISDGVTMRDGTFFIDRDGTHFKHIINHLRGLALSPCLDSRIALHELRQEALFYNVLPLVVEIDERMLCVEMLEDEEITHLEKALFRMESHNTGISDDEMKLDPVHVATTRENSPELLAGVTVNERAPSTLSSATVSPQLTATLLNSPERVRDFQGLRQRFQFGMPKETKAVHESSSKNPSLASPYTSGRESSTSSSLFSSALSYATNLVQNQQKPTPSFVVANPDDESSSDEDTFIRVTRTSSRARAGRSSILSGPDEVTMTNPAVAISENKEELQEKSGIPIGWNHGMPRSHELILHRLLMKRREWRLQQNLITCEQRAELNSIRTSDGSDSVVKKAVRLLNKSTWNSISKYNAKRLQQDHVFTAYEDDGAKPGEKGDGRIDAFIERVLERFGVLCSMPPPPRNDLLMNMCWSIGVGFAVSIEISLVILVLYVMF